ncbi:hypothetical protein BJX63DRAFT_426958 [Aspergillus granulosus]|uniref:Major facilitator superfamily (MFS) profile domain-containing protein n=1 Tax=Aspergillus granulosus TaxID=176169 RepID=A0ABR4I3Q0_9EURO
MTALQEAEQTLENILPPRGLDSMFPLPIPKDNSPTEAAIVPSLTGIRLGAIFTVLCLAVFLAALDNAIIATAILESRTNSKHFDTKVSDQRDS